MINYGELFCMEGEVRSAYGRHVFPSYVATLFLILDPFIWRGSFVSTWKYSRPRWQLMFNSYIYIYFLFWRKEIKSARLVGWELKLIMLLGKELNQQNGHIHAVELLNNNKVHAPQVFLYNAGERERERGHSNIILYV